MNHWTDKLSLIIITLWVGALWTAGAAAYVLGPMGRDVGTGFAPATLTESHAVHC